MEVFMRNISWNYDKNQVITELGVILHGTHFSDLSPVPINFHVYLHTDKKRLHKHGGTGTLTLPTLQFGNRFLGLYGSDFSAPKLVLVLGGKNVIFKASNQPGGRADVLETVTRFPYMDPKVLEARQRRDAQLDATTIAIRTIQFGWECRDQTFSIESEKNCEGHCDLTFDSERKEMRIKLQELFDTYIIAIKYSQVNYITAHNYLSHQEPIIFFSLSLPPTYERDRKPLRQRLSHLPLPDHERVAPYASLAIRLVCRSPNGLLTFSNCSKAAQIHNVYDYEYPVDRRGLFSSHKLEQLQDWLRHLNWCVTFQIEALVRSMAIDVAEALELIPDVMRIVKTKGKKVAASMLRKFGSKAKHLCWNVEEEFDLRQCFLDFEKECDRPTLLKPSEGSLCDVFHVMITPTTMFLDGPFLERSNRVIRMYEPRHQESFLRVSFMDEARLQYRFDREIDGADFIRSRVGPFLLRGLTIARREFEFLAYSQSALKEHAVWFVKPFKDKHRGFVDAETIINGLGDFKKLDNRLIYCPARYAARLSQAFTATDAVSVEVEEILPIGDISTADNKFHFTDGVGTLSPQLAREIWTQLKSTKRRARSLKTYPSAYQIRFMGSKGMLSVDYRLSGNATICLRPSMIKFEAPNSREIEIARAFDRPGPYFLNRPLIMLLEGLGVPFDVFKKYQDMAVLETKKAVQSLKQAATMLEKYGLGSSYRLPSVLLSLDKLGISNFPNNQFYEKMLENAINHVLRNLKNYARIPVPKAWTLVGVADVHSYLKPNEIFACIKPIMGRVVYLEGPVLISRSPTIHPGDVMVVNAIGSPPQDSDCPFAKEPLANTVVFSILGDRPVPSCLGGGDLDGDLYNLIPLNDLPKFHPTKLYPPAKYDPAPKKELDRPSTMADVAEFVMDYINSDVVGIVAINWLIIADQSEKGIFDDDCLKLANLHSNAVDYPKSGQPVSIKAIPKLKFPRRPDWNAPETVNAKSEEHYYPSKMAIGRLFRAIDLPVEARPNTRQPRSQRKAKRQPAVNDLIERFTHFDLDDARKDPVFDFVEDRVEDFIDTDKLWKKNDMESMEDLFRRYTSELQGICASNTLSHARSTLLSEEEAIIGTIAQKSSQPRKRKDMMSSLRDSTDILVRAIREELSGDEDPHEKSLERAWMAWQLSYTAGKTFGAQSFGWVALGAIFESIRQIEEADGASIRKFGLRS
ncbi:RNA-directed RNA polymerase 2 [Phlegmacium glaucopus]|nr:RNA-directed RNA polymerase 2 [Phlegmacium glaucopus]